MSQINRYLHFLIFNLICHILTSQIYPLNILGGCAHHSGKHVLANIHKKDEELKGIYNSHALLTKDAFPNVHIIYNLLNVIVAI